MQNLHDLQSILSYIFFFLQQFLSKFPCQPVALRPNMQVRFPIVHISKTVLNYSPSPFIFSAWRVLSRHYPNPFYLLLLLVLQFACFLRYIGPLTRIMSKNLASALLDPWIITEKLKDDLLSDRVILAIQSYPFILSPLGFILKLNSCFHPIYHLSHLQGSSVNDFISKEVSNLRYSCLKKVTDMVLQANHHYIIIKKDIKDAFHNFLVTFNM